MPILLYSLVHIPQVLRFSVVMIEMQVHEFGQLDVKIF